ncbi:hypothetical protein GHYDROH2_25890 [Geobacter hydrogenophilus]|uniref:Uncharacterized protein n=1 Tax=Geobacter hydrogenophilus TaxID=40983 RepID=A0A9W6LCS2_9BACT|nr:hypothetical protein GHYDROH2_25890 [Geobacter hydrogenophilus]
MLVEKIRVTAGKYDYPALVHPHFACVLDDLIPVKHRHFVVHQKQINITLAYYRKGSDRTRANLHLEYWIMLIYISFEKLRKRLIVINDQNLSHPYLYRHTNPLSRMIT